MTGWALLLVATVVATWTLPGRWLEPVSSPRIYAAGLLDAAWPVLTGVLLAVAVVAVRRRRGTATAMAPWVPAGDLVVLAEAASPAVSRAAVRAVRAVTAGRDRLGGLVGGFEARVRPGQGFAQLDVLLRRWQVAGLLFALVGVALIVALGAGPSGR